MSPMDALRMRAESRNAQPPVSPERAAANLKQTGYDIASMTPVIGNILAARDAYESGGETLDAARRGDVRGQRKAAVVTGLSALGALSPLPFSRMAGNAARGARDVAPAFPAWHGSPHDFDEFKLDKIGTGEGAQAYGHGLYFAENPKTAISYRDALEKKHQLNPQQGNLGDIRSAVDWLKSGRKGGAPPASGQHIDDAISDLRSDYVKGPFPNPTDAQIATHLEGNFVPRGRLYHTEIDAEPHQLLDWDKPLSQQNEGVKQSILKFAEGRGRGEEIKRWLADDGDWFTGGRFYDTLKNAGETQGDYAAAMRQAGIPGTRYLDQGSRGADAGTSNYVIFDDKLTKILSKE